jgi:hypothetical protein
MKTGRMKTACSVEGCGRPTKGRGWCSLHYQRWRHHGDPLGQSPSRGDLLNRLSNRMLVGDGCWDWTGSKAKGYGVLRWDGRPQPVHRLVYELFRGPIPDGLDLDHLCRRPSCVRPGHLEPVTRSENLRRSPLMGQYQTRKTHCPAGHPYAGENLVQYGGRRSCRTCRREGWARYRARRKERSYA